jgi:UDP-N-acetylglucosamine transferase subunit ALG13
MLRAVDAALQGTTEDVLFQIGNSTFVPSLGRHVAFLSRDEFESMIAAARIVITHAGVGTILLCAQAGKVPFLLPRLASYDEVIDDHQIEICEQLQRSGRAVYVRDLIALRELLTDSRTAEPHSHVSPLIDLIRGDLTAFAKTYGTRDPFRSVLP